MPAYLGLVNWLVFESTLLVISKSKPKDMLLSLVWTTIYCQDEEHFFFFYFIGNKRVLKLFCKYVCLSIKKNHQIENALWLQADGDTPSPPTYWCCFIGKTWNMTGVPNCHPQLKGSQSWAYKCKMKIFASYCPFRVVPNGGKWKTRTQPALPFLICLSLYR